MKMVARVDDGGTRVMKRDKVWTWRIVSRASIYLRPVDGLKHQETTNVFMSGITSAPVFERPQPPPRPVAPMVPVPATITSQTSSVPRLSTTTER